MSHTRIIALPKCRMIRHNSRHAAFCALLPRKDRRSIAGCGLIIGRKRRLAVGSMKFPALKAIALGVGLFVVVYVPAFVTTALVRPRIDIAIPLIIAITSLVALILMFLLARRPAGIAEFGFRIPHSRYLVVATVFGLRSESPSLFWVTYFHRNLRLTFLTSRRG